MPAIDKNKILDLMKKSNQPMDLKEMSNALSLKGKELEPILQEMEKKGLLVLTRKNKYGLPEQMNLRVGRLQRNQRGFGFVITDDPNEDDIYIAPDDLAQALNRDRVVIRLYKQIVPGKRAEGKVIRILEKANSRIVGTFEGEDGYGFLLPDDRSLGTDLFIPKKNANGAREGMKVVAEILDWPEKRKNPIGRVVEIIGQKGQPGIDIISIIKKHNLPEDFPNEVKSFVAKQNYQKISEKDMADRKDYRDLPMITIDGEDAKDLDDAVSFETLPNGNFYLGVHIADVGWYVREGSVLDKEAESRGTSVYLVDRVIPMLPRELSNGICSLNAGQDRLALSCMMEFDQTGKLWDYDISPSVICVDKRMTYTAVNKIISDEDPETIAEYEDFALALKSMNQLRGLLFDRRMQRGAIDFNFPESIVVVDESGFPIDIKRRERNLAESLIEEFMLAANETVSTHFHNLGIPFIYRVHEEPDSKKLIELKAFIGIFGYRLKGSQDKVFPKSYQEIIEKVKGKKEERIVSTMMLRSLRHARYSIEPLGHFGLSAQFYSHFTAPIRRYPDLAIHRVIRELIDKGNKMSAKRREALKERLEDYAQHSSVREMMAEEAERETLDLKKVEYMTQFVGDEFDGIVSGVTPFGIFVELENLVEGLVHISSMDKDYFIYDERTMALLGERTKERFTIGDQVKVKIVRTDIESRQIDMELVDLD